MCKARSFLSASLIAILLVVVGHAAVKPAQAGLLGETVSFDYHYPSLGTVLFPSGSAVVGAGVEFNNIGGFGVGVSPSADIGDTSFTVSYPFGWNVSGGITFDGWVLTASTADIVGASISSNTLGFTPVVTFDSTHVYVNQIGASFFSAGSSLTIDMEFAPVSVAEPATLAVLGLGLIGLGVSRRRRNGA